jgi:ElaB/YqjD/DUF883 family membrane-anchored ribosome-binding protein
MQADPLSKDKETQQLRDIEDLMKGIRRDVDAALIDVKAQLNAAQKIANRTITERPMLALGVAFIAGMALGIALSRSAD